MRAKKLAAVLLTVAMTVTSGITALAAPSGLSIIDGRTVSSKLAGFQVTFPADYEVGRDEASGGSADWLLGSALEGFESETSLDFTAVSGDENKSFLVNMGMVTSGQSVDLEAEMKELQDSLEAEADVGHYMTTGSCVIGGASYASIKINYGGMLAEYMRSMYEGFEMTAEEQQEADQSIAEMENMMFCDFYMRQLGGNLYIISQVYSGDRSAQAAQVLGMFMPYSGAGWINTQENGWQYQKNDGSLAANQWVMDEDGLMYHMDGNGVIQYNTWIEESGKWKYVDEYGHMITLITKTIDNVQYTFDSAGYLIDGSERSAENYSIGSISGQTYSDRWANLAMTFPAAAELRLGDGTSYSYPLMAGEHMDYDDPELGYAVTVDYYNVYENLQLDRYLELLESIAEWDDHSVTYSGSAMLGGYEYKVCKTTLTYGDGSAHHSDTYVRQIDGRLVEITIEYYGELQASVDSVLASVMQVR